MDDKIAYLIRLIKDTRRPITEARELITLLERRGLQVGRGEPGLFSCVSEFSIPTKMKSNRNRDTTIFRVANIEETRAWVAQNYKNGNKKWLGENGEWQSTAKFSNVLSIILSLLDREDLIPVGCPTLVWEEEDSQDAYPIISPGEKEWVYAQKFNARRDDGVYERSYAEPDRPVRIPIGVNKRNAERIKARNDRHADWVARKGERELWEIIKRKNGYRHIEEVVKFMEIRAEYPFEGFLWGHYNGPRKWRGCLHRGGVDGSL